MSSAARVASAARGARASAIGPTAACACAGRAVAASGQTNAAAATTFAATSATVSAGRGRGARAVVRARVFRTPPISSGSEVLAASEGCARAEWRSSAGGRCVAPRSSPGAVAGAVGGGGGGARGGQTTGVHAEHHVGAGDHHGVVGRDEHGGPGRRDARNGGIDHPPCVVVESACRFVDQQHPGARCRLDRERQAPPLACGQVARMPRPQQPGPLAASEQRGHAGDGGPDRQVRPPVGAATFRGDRVAHEQRVGVVGHQPHVASVRARGEGDQKARLAGSVGPDQRHHLARVQRHGDIVDGQALPVADGHPRRERRFTTPEIRSGRGPRRPFDGEGRRKIRSCERRGSGGDGRGRRCGRRGEMQPHVRDAGELGAAVLGDDHAHAGLVRECAQQRHDPGARGAVEVGERFIHEQQQRLLDDGGGDGDERRLAGRELPQRPVEQFGDTHPTGDVADALVDEHAGEPSQLQRQPDLIAHGRRREADAGVLQHHTDEPRQVARRRVGAIVPRDRQATVEPPAVEVGVQPAQRAQQRGLTRSGGAGDHRQRAGADAVAGPIRPDAPPVDGRDRVAGEAEGERCEGDRAAAVALEPATGVAAQLQRRSDGGGPLDRRLEQRRQRADARAEPALAAQALRAPGRACRVGERRKRGPRDRQRPREPLEGTAPCPAREQSRQIEQCAEHPEGDDRQRDRQRADDGRRQPVGRDRAEHLDVGERRREPPHRQRQQHRAAAVHAVEEHPVHDPDRHEADRQREGGAQGTGAEAHAPRLRASAAISGGRVHAAGEAGTPSRVKSSSTLSPGCAVSVDRPSCA